MTDYKLTYFNGRGRAEITRLIFAAAGQKFTDERIDFAEWPSKKANTDAPLGQLPFLTLGGLKLPQSISIARFVAKRFNLYGSDEVEQAKTDAIVDTVKDLEEAFYNKVFEGKPEDRPANIKSFLSENAPNHLGKIDKLISLWGSNGYSVGSSLKWSDLYIYSITSEIKGIDANVLSKYSGIVGVNKTVDTNPKISAYLKNRPVTQF